MTLLREVHAVAAISAMFDRVSLDLNKRARHPTSKINKNVADADFSTI